MKIQNLGLLAGGQSRRMHFPKPMLLVNQQPLLERHCQAAQQLQLNTHVLSDVLYPIDYYQAQLLKDTTPGQGPIGGLLTLLKALQKQSNHKNSWVMVMACDQLLSIEDLLKSFEAFTPKAETDIIVFKGESIHPLIGFYKTSLLPSLKRYMKTHKSLMGFIQQEGFETLAFEGQSEILANFNTQEAFIHALNTL